MPYTSDLLPFASSTSPLASHASYQGAESATGRAGEQTLRLLAIYAQRGPTADWEAARLMGVERTSINARRVPLVKRGIVVAVDTAVNGETGIHNTRWGLATSGQ
jgi:hypothetical protein